MLQIQWLNTDAQSWIHQCFLFSNIVMFHRTPATYFLLPELKAASRHGLLRQAETDLSRARQRLAWSPPGINPSSPGTKCHVWTLLMFMKYLDLKVWLEIVFEETVSISQWKAWLPSIMAQRNWCHMKHQDNTKWIKFNREFSLSRNVLACQKMLMTLSHLRQWENVQYSGNIMLSWSNFRSTNTARSAPVIPSYWKWSRVHKRQHFDFLLNLNNKFKVLEV